MSTPQPAPKQGLHPRNRHRERYEFDRLVASCPELAPYLARNPYGDVSVDFGDPAAVRVLNKALLAHFYGVVHWEIPADYLCPPIPGRADCLHHLADLLASCHGGVIPKGPEVRVLDIGTGASCIYPLLGHREYGWRFLASDIDAGALAAAQRILAANGLGGAIELRRQGCPGAASSRGSCGRTRSSMRPCATRPSTPPCGKPGKAPSANGGTWAGRPRARPRGTSAGRGPSCGARGARPPSWPG